MSLLRLRQPRGGLTAGQKSAEGIIGHGVGKARAFDEKVESLIVDSHDGANRIQDPHWCKGGQS